MSIIVIKLLSKCHLKSKQKSYPYNVEALLNKEMDDLDLNY